MISSIRVTNVSFQPTRIVGTTLNLKPGMSVDLLVFFSIADIANLYGLPSMIDANLISVVFIKDNAASNVPDGASFTNLIQVEIGGGGSGPGPGPGFTVTTVYVDGVKGNDATADGTSAKPYKTIQRGANKIGSAKNAGDFNDSASSEWMLILASGTYNENVVLPVRHIIQIGMEAVTINGNISQVVDPSKFYGGLVNETKVIFKGLDGAQAGPGVPPSQINGNVLVHCGGPMRCSVQALHCTLNGDLTFESGASPYEAKLCLVHSDVLGVIAATNGGTLSLYSATGENLPPGQIGGVSGNVALAVLFNTEFTGPVVTNSPVGGKWTRTVFDDGVAHDFSGASGILVCDSASAASFQKNVPLKGSTVVELLENAQHVFYTPFNAAHWKGQPTNTRDALDQLAKRVTKIGG